MDGMKEEYRHQARQLYDKILHVANQFLVNCKLFQIETLAEEDPTYEEVGNAMHDVGKIVYALAEDFDPHMAQKAIEFCHLMKQMGAAIRNQNQVELSGLVATLDRRPFV